MRRALVSLPDGVWDILDNSLKGKLGDNDSELIRHIVILYLTEKGYTLKDQGKQKSQLAAPIDDIASQLDIHDAQIEALVELLEEKGYIDTDQWSRRIKKKLDK